MALSFKLERVSTPMPSLLLKCLKIHVSKNPFFLWNMKLQQMLVGVYRLGSLSVLAEAARHCTSCGSSAKAAPVRHCAAHLVASLASGSSAGSVLSELICLQHSNLTVSAGMFRKPVSD